MTDAQIVQEGIATVVILVGVGVGFYVYGWLWADKNLKRAEAVLKTFEPPAPAPVRVIEPMPGPVKRLAVGEDEV